MTTDEEVAQIMEMICGKLFPQIDAIAGQYVTETLHAEATPNLRTTIASTFCRACGDWLHRDSEPRVQAYRSEAAALESALQVLRQNSDVFHMTMASSLDSDPITVDAPPGVPGPIRIYSDCAAHALWGIEQMAKRARKAASDFNKDKKNITFLYCLKRLFGANGRYFFNDAPLPVPTAEQANAVSEILYKATHDVAPHLLKNVKTAFDPTDVRRRLRSPRPKRKQKSKIPP